MGRRMRTGAAYGGAGGITREAFPVRGSPTAASIGAPAAIGILAGVGFYFAAAVGTVLALGTLSLFRWVEARLPTESYASFMVRFKRGTAMPEAELRRLVSAHGFSVYNMSYRPHGDTDVMEYRTVIRTM